jgi:hypothetical protein
MEQGCVGDNGGQGVVPKQESSNDGSDLLEPAMWKRLGRLEAENTVSPSTTSSKYLLTSTVT